MAVLFVPDQNVREENPQRIKEFFNARGLLFEQWPTHEGLTPESSQADILAAYREELDPYMAWNGYQTADVINVSPQTEGIDQLRTKFLSEHTHSEDEVRFFVNGEGFFWFNLDNGVDPVFCLKCERGDLISVPAGTKHWFDFGPQNSVQCIRVFIDPSGWVADYTQSGVDAPYNALQIGQ